MDELPSASAICTGFEVLGLPLDEVFSSTSSNMSRKRKSTGSALEELPKDTRT